MSHKWRIYRENLNKEAKDRKENLEEKIEVKEGKKDNMKKYSKYISILYIH